MAKILIIDDDIAICELIKINLELAGYTCHYETNPIKGFAILAQEDFDLLILDVMMGEVDGYSVALKIRQQTSELKNLPIIMLTAKTEERDELQGFELGVDEYISKPFSPKILVARVEAILRRANAVAEEAMEIGGIRLDKAAHSVKIDGEPIDLSVKEFELLEFFVTNKGVALSREKILNNVWNYDYYGDSRTIDSHIKKIRHKLGRKGKYIHTMRGVGYKFDENI